MTCVVNPVKQRQAHEQPVIYYSIILGLIGPALLVTVPPLRQSLGWKPAERPPTSYPCEFYVPEVWACELTFV